MVASIFAAQQPAFAGFGPININPPVVSGGGLVGEELTCDPGVWSSEPDVPTFTYQWKRDGVAIPGETNNTYTNVQDDVGHDISCTVTATNSKGSASADSNSVQIGGAPVNTASPVLTGDALIGATLTVTNGTWNAFPAPSEFHYTWLRQGLPIQSGAPDQNTYVVQSGDEGSVVQCDVTATNFFGTSPASRSNGVGPMQRPLSAPVNTSVPITNGENFVGLVIDCGNGIWDANPDPTYTYQWQADQTDIVGATANEYTLTSNEVGKMMRVKVTATNSEGSADAFSAESGPVVNP